MKEKIILLGGGGHAKSVIDAIRSQNQYEVIGILDTRDKVGTQLEGMRVIGVDEDLKTYYAKGLRYAFIGLGSVGNPSLRVKLHKILEEIGYTLPNIVDKSAILAQSVELGEGCFIGKGAIINSGTVIGSSCIINTGVVIEHDCKVANFVHLSPRAVLGGHVSIGEKTHIGMNATVIQGINIGKDSLIGAGSVVVRDVGNQIKAYGCPCKEIGKNE